MKNILNIFNNKEVDELKKEVSRLTLENIELKNNSKVTILETESDGVNIIPKKLTPSEEFINKARLIHGHKFNYSKVNYVNVRTNIIIRCSIHGEFSQRPDNHLQGKGCPECGWKRNPNILDNQEIKKIEPMIVHEGKTSKRYDYFINKSKEIHNNKYDYSLVKYVDSTLKVKIICPEHGEFEQRPNNHMNKKQGCPRCVGRQLKINPAQQILVFEEYDEDTYSPEFLEFLQLLK